MRIAARGFASLLAAAYTACAPLGGDLSSSPGTPDSPAHVVVALQSSAVAGSRAITLTAFYRTVGGQSVQLARATASMAPGSVTVPLDVDIAPCLSDAAGPGTGDTCPLLIGVAVRDDVGALVDSTAVGPFAARVGQSAIAPAVAFAAPASIALGAVRSLGLLVGDTATLIPTLRDSAGRVLPAGGVRWSSSDGSRVTVDSVTATMTAVRTGFAWIRAARSGRIDSVVVFVVPTATNAACRGRFDILPFEITRDTTVGGPGRLLRTPSATGLLISAGGVLRIAAGTTMCLDVGAITVANGGTVQSIGSVQSPVRLLGADTVRGWAGITLTNQPIDSSRFVFTEIRHAFRGNFAVLFQQYASNSARHPFRAEDVTIGPTNMRAIWANEVRGGVLLRRVVVESAADSVIQPEFSNAAVGVTDSATVEDLTIRRSGGNGLYVAAFGSTTTPTAIRLRNVRIDRAARSGVVIEARTSVPRAVGLRVSNSGEYPVTVQAAALGLLPADSAGYAALRSTARDSIRVFGGTLSAADTIIAVGPIPWRVDSTLTIPTGSLLRLTDGTRFVFAPGALVFATGGSLQIAGSATAPVILGARDTILGWGGLNVTNSKDFSVDRAVISDTRRNPAVQPSGTTLSRISRTVFRRFNAFLIRTPPIGVVIEDTRFEPLRPAAGSPSFPMLSVDFTAGTIFELRRSVFSGAGVPVPGVAIGSVDGGRPTRLLIDSVTFDFLGSYALAIEGPGIDSTNLTLRAINFLNSGERTLLSFRNQTAFNARGLWWGSTAGPRAASSAGDVTPGVFFNPALINVLPWATAPHVFPDPPRAPAAIVVPSNPIETRVQRRRRPSPTRPRH